MSRSKIIKCEGCQLFKNRMNEISVHIFPDKRKLREHFVKHMIKKPEFERWNDICGFDAGRCVRKSLKNILAAVNCDWDFQKYDNKKHSEIYCYAKNRTRKRCPTDKYQLCGRQCESESIEEKYIDAIDEVLTDTFGTPRHVHYAKQDGKYIACFGIGSCVVVLKEKKQENRYKVLSAYVSTDRECVLNDDEVVVDFYYGTELRSARLNNKQIHWCLPEKDVGIQVDKVKEIFDKVAMQE